MDTFDLLVVFKDGSEVVVKSITSYGLYDEQLKVAKNNSCQYFNWSEVKYCGRLSDLR